MWKSLGRSPANLRSKAAIEIRIAIFFAGLCTLLGSSVRKAQGKVMLLWLKLMFCQSYNHDIFPNIHDMKVISLHVAVEEYEKRSIRKHLLPQAGWLLDCQSVLRIVPFQNKGKWKGNEIKSLPSILMFSAASFSIVCRYIRLDSCCPVFEVEDMFKCSHKHSLLILSELSPANVLPNSKIKIKNGHRWKD